jgi:hypothetical protein
MHIRGMGGLLVVVLELVSLLHSGSVTRGASTLTEVKICEGMHERDISAYLDGAKA